MGGLNKFEGQDVITAGIEIPRAGAGLHDALRVSPRELQIGDEVHVVMRLKCRKVRFDPVKDMDALNRVHVMEPEVATFVDADLVEDHLAEQRERLRAAEEEASGQPPLPLDKRA